MIMKLKNVNLLLSSCWTNILTFYLTVFQYLQYFGTTDAVVKIPKNVTIPAIFVFGDSTVDTGNNNNLKTLVKANFSPYGKDFLGGKPTGRFCNGRVPADLLAEELGIKQLLPPYLDPDLKLSDLITGVNFASGGSGFDPITSELVSVLSLKDQVNLFKEYIRKLRRRVGKKKAKSIIRNSMYFLAASSDDIANTYFHSPTRFWQYDNVSYTNLMINSASSFLKELVSEGARRIGVISAPPVGCLPSQRTLGGGPFRKCAKEYNKFASMYNKHLSAELDRLNRIFSTFHVSLVFTDLYFPLLDIITHPTKYGFEVVDRGCCGTGLVEVGFTCNQWSPYTCTNASRYVFWDSYHPTERTYKILVGNLLPKYISALIGLHRRHHRR